MKNNFVIGYTSGVFDLFHIGHLNILKNASSLCDKLIVGVSTDKLVESYKNKTPIIKFSERIEIVRSIEFVDAVIAQDTMDKYDIWQKLKFNTMVVGDDWYKTEKWESIEENLKDCNVKIVYFPHTKGTSSTLINEILEKERQIV
jgi:glycerol-3-phosphate cytidylyltransferase